MTVADVAEVLAAWRGNGRPAHVYVRGRGQDLAVTRGELRERVARRAGALARLGVSAGDPVGVLASEAEVFLPIFLALLWLGAVAVPLPPPPLGRRDAWRAALGTALARTRPRLLCGPAAALSELAGGTRCVAAEELAPAREHRAPVSLPGDALAYLQFTSGSTGTPRAVRVTRGSLAANCAAITAGLALDPARDVGVSWLPLHHDMGLVGFGCAALTAGVPVVFVPTALFLRDPEVWMRTMSAYRGTVTFGPSFAYSLAARRGAAGSGGSALDLSRVRVLGCGAEPVNPAALRRFLAAYGEAGLDPAALTPAYGLAEATLAVSFARGLRTGAAGAVDCGHPVPGHEVAVAGETGAPRAAGEVGEVWVRGPSVAAGYLGDPAPEVFGDDGWLRTGDLGYTDGDGRLYLTGRARDLLVVRGVNTDPHLVEWAAAAVPGVREGGVVAFTRPGAETEEVVVVAECAYRAPRGLPDAVRAAIASSVGLAVADVVRVPAGTIPKTTSGKPRRQETRRRYLAGELHVR